MDVYEDIMLTYFVDTDADANVYFLTKNVVQMRVGTLENHADSDADIRYISSLHPITGNK